LLAKLWYVWFVVDNFGGLALLIMNANMAEIIDLCWCCFGLTQQPRTFPLNGYPSMLILSTFFCWPVCFTSRIKAMTNHQPYNCLCCLLKIIALSMYLVKWYTTVLNNYKSNGMQMSWIYPTLTMDTKGITHITVNFA
jgi:hypothetical protein